MFKMFVLAFIASIMMISSVVSDSSKKENEYHFRSAKFGMTINQVKSSEESEPVFEDGEALVYEDSIIGIKTDVYYSFVNNSLWRGTYFTREKYTNDNLYIEDFLKIKKALTEKYGDPDIDREDWSQSHYKSDREKYGFAVSMGYLEYVVQWNNVLENRESYIMLILRGNNFEIPGIKVFYTDELLEEVYRKQKEKKENSKL